MGFKMSSASKVSVGVKLKLLMVFLVLTLLTSSVLSFLSAHKFIKQIDELGNVQFPGNTNMQLIDMMHDGIRANVYAALLAINSKDQEEKKVIKEEQKEFAANIQKYIAELQKIHLHEDTLKAIGPVLPKVEAYVKSAEEIVDAALADNQEKAMVLRPQFNTKFKELETVLAKLGELIEVDAGESTAYGAVLEQNALYFNITSLVCGIVLMTFFFFVIREQQNQLEVIIGNLNLESKRISETANNINSAAKNLSDSTNTQTSAFQESAAALEEINVTLSSTEANSVRLDENAKISYETASNGKATIEEMLSAMNVIKSSNAAMMTQIEESNKRIGAIVTVIGEIENKTKVINEIVFQTKLLSFNASVEAARAGEQGKGFAVVAEEVGNLAQMSGNAAKEISEMLSTSIRTVENIVYESKTKVESIANDGRLKVEQGIEIANKCGNALEQIVLQASSIGSLISEITTAVGEQSKGINEISSAMALLDQASNQNSITSKENLDSSNDLQDQVYKLEGVIESLGTMMTSKQAA
jgi:methyl-accepting chemotaxis protein